jgi:hypothetical protein
MAAGPGVIEEMIGRGAFRKSQVVPAPRSCLICKQAP